MLNTFELNANRLNSVLVSGGGGGGGGGGSVHVPGTPWTAQNYFNFSDWNRIESNVAALVTLLQKFGYNLSLTTITNRVDGSTLDFYDSLNRIEGNTQALFNCYGIIPQGWITPKTTWTFEQPFSYVDANRMEDNLQTLYNLIAGIETPFCGQNFAICGLGWFN